MKRLSIDISQKWGYEFAKVELYTSIYQVVVICISKSIAVALVYIQ